MEGRWTDSWSSVRITVLVSSTSWAQDQLPGFRSTETFFRKFLCCSPLAQGRWLKRDLPVTHSGQNAAPPKHLVDVNDDSLYSNSILFT